MATYLNTLCIRARALVGPLLHHGLKRGTPKALKGLPLSLSFPLNYLKHNFLYDCVGPVYYTKKPCRLNLNYQVSKYKLILAADIRRSKPCVSVFYI